jgi:small basic protein (TIGR04137 family)
MGDETSKARILPGSPDFFVSRTGISIMSIHKSLKLKNSLVGQRSVLTRWERIEKLQEQDLWREGDTVLGLPKVRTKFKVRSRKAIKREAAEAAQLEKDEAKKKK